MTPARKFVYKRIMDSLDANPELWSFGEYEATCGNMKVWVVNRYYATKFSMGSIHQDNNRPFWWLFPCEYWRVSLIRKIEHVQYKRELEQGQ